MTSLTQEICCTGKYVSVKITHAFFALKIVKKPCLISFLIADLVKLAGPIWIEFGISLCLL
jgi:hypothetical protein